MAIEDKFTLHALLGNMEGIPIKQNFVSSHMTLVKVLGHILITNDLGKWNIPNLPLEHWHFILMSSILKFKESLLWDLSHFPSS